MPTGLQVYNSSGNLVLDTNDRVGIILGVFDIPSGGSIMSGSETNDGLLLGTPFFYLRGIGSLTSMTTASLSVSGNVLSWTKPFAYSFAHRVLYGVF